MCMNCVPPMSTTHKNDFGVKTGCQLSKWRQNVATYLYFKKKKRGILISVHLNLFLPNLLEVTHNNMTLF